jgi:hypothetical protein
MYFLSFTSKYRPPNNPAELFPHFKGKSGGAVYFFKGLPGESRARRAILALLCILITLGAKLKSPIPKVSGSGGSRPISIK